MRSYHNVNRSVSREKCDACPWVRVGKNWIESLQPLKLVVSKQICDHKELDQAVHILKSMVLWMGLYTKKLFVCFPLSSRILSEHVWWWILQDAENEETLFKTENRCQNVVNCGRWAMGDPSPACAPARWTNAMKKLAQILYKEIGKIDTGMAVKKSFKPMRNSMDSKSLRSLRCNSLERLLKTVAGQVESVPFPASKLVSMSMRWGCGNDEREIVDRRVVERGRERNTTALDLHLESSHAQLLELHSTFHVPIRKFSKIKSLADKHDACIQRQLWSVQNNSDER